MAGHRNRPGNTPPYSFNLNTSANFTYTPLFYLPEGKYRLEIIPMDDHAKLDVV